MHTKEKRKVDKAETIRHRARQVMAYRNDEETLAEATKIKELIDNIADEEISHYLDTPQHIKGLLPQCLGGKIKVRLSNYCAHRAMFELFKNPFPASLAEEWVSAAEDCAKEELTYFLTKPVAQSVNGSNKRPDGLQVLIDEIVANSPDIKPKQLLEELRRLESGDVIDNINDDEGTIEWRDENNPAGISPISGLKDRLSRAKRKTSSL